MSSPRDEKILKIINILQTSPKCTLSTADFPDDSVTPKTKDLFYKTFREGKAEVTLEVDDIPSTEVSKQLEKCQIHNVNIHMRKHTDDKVTTAFVTALNANSSIRKTSLHLCFDLFAGDDDPLLDVMPSLFALPSLKSVNLASYEKNIKPTIRGSIVSAALRSPTLEECSIEYSAIQLSPPTKSDISPIKSSLKCLNMYLCNTPPDDMNRMIEQIVANQLPIRKMEFRNCSERDGYSAIAKHIATAPWISISIDDDRVTEEDVALQFITALKNRTAPCFLKLCVRLSTAIIRQVIELVNTNPAILDFDPGTNQPKTFHHLRLRNIISDKCLRFVHDYIGEPLSGISYAKNNSAADAKSFVTYIGAGLFASQNPIPPELTKIMAEYTQSLDNETLNEVAHEALHRYFQYEVYDSYPKLLLVYNLSGLMEDRNYAEILTSVQNLRRRDSDANTSLQFCESRLQTIIDLQRRINQHRDPRQAKMPGI